MKKTIALCMWVLICICISRQALANSAPVISNVQASQRGDASKVVDIFFSLADTDGDSCTVWIAVSDDGGATWIVPVNHCSGHFGPGVAPDSNRHIVWDAGADIAGKSGSNFKVRVLADDGKGPSSMVLVTGGSYLFQNTTWTYVNTFMIDKYEVTNALYCQYLNAADPNAQHWTSNMEITRHGNAGSYYYLVNSGRENYPIRYVSYYDAEAFALWRSQLEGLTYRLPSGLEWEKAAAWDPVQQKYYTFGFHSDGINSFWCNYSNFYYGPLPVGSFNGTGGKSDAKSYYGCYDMSGNVWEWTSDISTSYHILRGGYWTNNSTGCECKYLGCGTPSYREASFGFRLVLESN